MSDVTTTSSSDDATGKPQISREKQREREKVSRQRRNDKIDGMKRQVEALECAVSAMRFISDPDVIWDEFLAPEDKRVRGFLRDSIKLLEESKHLQLEHDALQKLLGDYENAKRVIMQMLKEVNTDAWDWNVKRWRAYTRLHFQPWTMEDCQADIDAGLRDMNNFLYGKGITQSTGLSFLGWRDQRRIDPNTNTLHFSLYKTLRGYDMQRNMDHFWDIYHIPELYKKIVLGGHGVVSIDILQQVTPLMTILRYVEQYPGIHITAHFLYLLYRVETEGGFTQCLRSIDCPDIQKTADGENDVWASNFFWIRWEVLGDGKDLTHTDYRVTIWRWRHGVTDAALPWTATVASSALRGSMRRAFYQAATSLSTLHKFELPLRRLLHGLERQQLGEEPRLPSEPSSETDQHLLFFDGGSRGNPGPGGSGAVVVRTDAFGGRPCIIWAAAMSLADPTTTNNQAEYLGLVTGLRFALHSRLQSLTVIGDSAMIIKQLREHRAPRDPRLRRRYGEARILADVLRVTKWRHHVRAYNKMADCAANLAMDTRSSVQTLDPLARSCWAGLRTYLSEDVAQWQASTHPGQTSVES